MHTVIKSIASAVLAASFIASPAYADNDRHHRGKHDKHWNKHDRHWNKHDRHRSWYYPHSSQHVVIVRPPVYRSYYSSSYYNQPAYYNNATYSSVRCTNQNNPLGLILGGAAGGILGHQVGKGHGKTAATITGAVIGSALGNGIGQYCSEEVFSTVPLGTPVVWQSPNNYENMYVTATRDFQNDGRYCREYQAAATVGGRQQQTYGTACMEPDGSWEIVN